MRCRKCAPLPGEVREAAGLLERRWTVSIICASHEGAVRFNEFLQVLGPVPPEERDGVPHDGAKNHDHYLYGAPKKDAA